MSTAELAPPPPPLRRRMQRLDVIADRERQIHRLMAQQRLEVAALAREDRGPVAERFVRDELALAWARSPRQAQNRLDDAQLFEAFPAVVSRVADGTWLMDHADAVLGELSGSGLDQQQQEQVLDLVLSRPGGRTPWELRAQVRTALVVLFPDHTADRAEKARLDRDVKVYADSPGAASLLAHGPAPQVAAMMTALDTLVWPAASDDPRSAAQRRFDALYDLVCGRAQAGQWQLQVLVSLAALEGQSALPAEIPGFGPVPVEQARELLADGATLRRVVVDDHGRLVAVDDAVHRPDLPAAPAPAAAATRPSPDPARQHPPAPDQWVREEQDPDAPSDADLAWHAAQPPDRASADLDRGTDAVRDTQLRAAAVDESPLGGHPSEQPSEDSGSDGTGTDRGDRATRRDGTARAAFTPRAGASAGTWSARALTKALQRLRSDPHRPTELSSDAYTPSRRLKRYLALRDRTCVFPGCPRLAARCDKDHLVPWPRGSTCTDNLASECEHHHLAKHHCFTVTRRRDGTVRWTSPTGHVHDRAPVPVLVGWPYEDRLSGPARAEGVRSGR